MTEQQSEPEFSIDNVLNNNNESFIDELESLSPLKPSSTPKEDKPPIDDAPIKQKEPHKESKQVEKNSTSEDDEDSDIDEKEPPKSKEIDYRAENEKTQKILKDTQKSFHEDRKKLSAYRKAVEQFKEDGLLTDEEAATLLDHTKFEDIPEEVPLLLKYSNVWDKEFEYMKKYSSNPEELEQNKQAFIHFMRTAHVNELEEVLHDLSKYEDDEVEFTKQMLEVGRQYNEDIYADIHEAGSIRKIKSKYIEEIEDLKKKLEKKDKELIKFKQKYEDYDDRPANLNLPAGSGSHNKTTHSGHFNLSSILDN